MTGEIYKETGKENTTPKRKILAEVNLEGPVSAEIDQRVIRLIEQKSPDYFKLSVGRRWTLDNEHLMMSTLGIFIYDKGELQAVKDIFTGKEIDSAISNNKNKDGVIKEVLLDAGHNTENAPRAVRLAINNSDFFLQIGAKKPLNSGDPLATRNMIIDKKNLPAMKKLFENLIIQ